MISDVLSETLALASRILATEGLIGPFGHISARSGPSAFLISLSEAVGVWIEPGDLGEFDTSISPEAVKAQRLYSEIFIHSSAYRELPGVNAVAHTHSPYATALSTLAAPDDKV